MATKGKNTNAIFFFFLDGLSFSDFFRFVEREKFDKVVKDMYRSVKGEIASCSGLSGKRRDGVSNIPDRVAVCCFHGGDLWKQQNRKQLRRWRTTSKRSFICLHRLLAKDGHWVIKPTSSAVTLQEERILRKQWNGLQRNKLFKEKRGKTV